jgi:hypothetical protein
VDSVVGDTVVLMNLDKLDYYGLNQVARRVWEIVNESPSTRDDIIRTLLEEFDVDEDTCRKEVDGFIREGVERGFLVTQ